MTTVRRSSFHPRRIIPAAGVASPSAAPAPLPEVLSHWITVRDLVDVAYRIGGEEALDVPITVTAAIPGDGTHHWHGSTLHPIAVSIGCNGPEITLSLTPGQAARLAVEAERP